MTHCDHQHRADDRRAPRLRPARLQHQHRHRPGRDEDDHVHGQEAASSRTTARTSARRCIRRCRATSREAPVATPSSGRRLEAGRAGPTMSACIRRRRFLHQPIGPRRARCSSPRRCSCSSPYFLPLWNLTMFAPQYPDGLRLDIYDHTLVGGNDGQDVKEINLLNHYIGMHDLTVEDFTEFKWMPFVLGGIALLLLRAAVFGTVKELVDAARGVRVLRRVLALVVWLPDVPLRPRPRAGGAGEGRPLHAADVRLPEDRELRGLFLSAAAGPTCWAPWWSCSRWRAWWLAWRRARPRAALATETPWPSPRPRWRSCWSRRATPAMPAIAAGRLEGRPAAAAASPLQARIDAAAPARRSTSSPAPIAATCTSIGRFSSSATAVRGSSGPGHGSVVRIRAADVVDRGLRHRRADGRQPRRRLVRHPRRRARARRSAMSASTRALLRRLPARGGRRHRRATRRSAACRASIRASRDRASTSTTRSASGSSATTSPTCATASTSSRPTAARVTRQHGPARCATACTTCSPTTTSFEDNRFEDGAAGAALMYSKRLAFRRNRFLHNRGFASVGLLLKDCEDVVAEDNLIADNARGVFLEGSNRNAFRRNVIAVSDVGDRPVRLEPAQRVRGQRVRRESVAARARRAPHRHRVRRELLVRRRRARSRRRRGPRPCRTGCRACSIICAAT